MGRRPRIRDRSANSRPAPKNGRMATPTNRAPRPPAHWVAARRNRRPWSLPAGSIAPRAVVVRPAVASASASTTEVVLPTSRWRPASRPTSSGRATATPDRTWESRTRSGGCISTNNQAAARPDRVPARRKTVVSSPAPSRSTSPDEIARRLRPPRAAATACALAEVHEAQGGPVPAADRRRAGAVKIIRPAGSLEQRRQDRCLAGTGHGDHVVPSP